MRKRVGLARAIAGIRKLTSTMSDLRARPGDLASHQPAHPGHATQTESPRSWSPTTCRAPTKWRTGSG
jgi:hypothetical protein